MNDNARTALAGPAWPLSEWFSELAALLRAEMAPSPRRIATTLRLAVIGSIGTGLMAACHVASGLGPYLIWLLLGPVAMMSPRKALGNLALVGVFLAVSFPIAGALSEAPWLILPVVGTFTAASTYAISRLKLGAIGLLLQVVTLDGFYGVIFAPSDFGWQVSSLFGASAIAFALIVLFDNWIWPDPAEAILLESISEATRRQRAALLQATESYLHRAGPNRPQPSAVASEMQSHLALLQRAVDEGLRSHRYAVMLAATNRTERLGIHVNRLILAARENVPRGVRGLLDAEIRAACHAIAEALQEIAREARVAIRSGADQPASPAAARVQPALEEVDRRFLEVRPGIIGSVGADELINLAAFVESLRAIGRLIERPLDEPPARDAERRRTQPPLHDPALPRYCAKVALCIVVAYVAALTSQQPDLSVILTTVIISALPTYGATLRKMILRIAGAVLGGIVTIAAIIVVSPNFESVLSYVIAVFVVLIASGYTSLGSGRVAYAGKQIGTTFLLAFAGLSPSIEIYGPLWRIWGILLGTVVVAVAFFLLWPEYAGDSLLPRLRSALRDTIQLMPGGTSTVSNRSIIDQISKIARTLSQILEVADDSRLEGRKSLIDHDAVVQAAGTLRRIANRLGAIALGALQGPLPRLDEAIETSGRTLLAMIGERLESWRAFYESPNPLNRRRAQALAARHSPEESRQILDELTRLIEERSFARVSFLTIEQRRIVLNQLQSFRRLEVLMSELDQYLSHVPGGAAGGSTLRLANA